SIVGVARRTEVRGSLGPVDPATGDLERISRVDINRLEPQMSSPLVRFYLQLVEPRDVAELPLTLPVPEPGGGPPHLSYAVQWFVFAGVVVVGYPLLMRSTARKRHAQD
ncbi:MAG: SURF1 family protein, partial [Acidimicrobiia bacterium]|nr:SURF1 family protein [Acidimicrobiia bacterium]